MSQYLASSPNQITLSTKFFSLELDNGNLEIDVQGLMKADKNSKDAWINITPILKAYDVRFEDWRRNKGVQDYINLANSEFSKTRRLRGLKIPFKSSMWYKSSDFEWLEQDCPLICTRRGRYHAGTWIHRDLFLEFITVLDVKIRWYLHKAIEKVIQQATLVKIERTGTKVLFHELTDTIKDIYIPAQTSPNAKKFAYSALMTLANIKVLGCTAKKYCNDHDIEITSEMISVRDALSDKLLDKIKQAEKDINGFIKYASITDYDELKERLLKL